MSTSNKGEENKEENPLLTRGFGIFLRKTKEIICQS